MARRKNISTDEAIELCMKNIEAKKNELLELENQLNELRLQKKEEDKEEIYKRMLSKNMSVEDLLNLISKVK